MSSGMPSRMWFSSHSNVWSSVESEWEGGPEGDGGRQGGRRGRQGDAVRQKNGWDTQMEAEGFHICLRIQPGISYLIVIVISYINKSEITIKFQLKKLN